MLVNGKNLWVNVSLGHFPALVGKHWWVSSESSQQEKTLGNLGPRGLRASLVLVWLRLREPPHPFLARHFEKKLQNIVESLSLTLRRSSDTPILGMCPHTGFHCWLTVGHLHRHLHLLHRKEPAADSHACGWWLVETVWMADCWAGPT